VDKKSQDRIISYINSKLRDQAAVLLVEHNMNVVENVCDKLVALDRGRVISEGTPGEVLHDSKVVASYFGK
jgi:ABC-type branched-subunit amino acid transport system ATPase component